MNQKLSDLASIAEIVSSVAIVITIAVLILELRSNSALLERQIELDRIDRISVILADAELAEILQRTGRGGQPSRMERLVMNEFDLTLPEAAKFGRYTGNQWQAVQADFAFFGPTERLEERIFGMLLRPGQAFWWQHKSPNLWTDEFQQFVDGIADDRR